MGVFYQMAHLCFLNLNLATITLSSYNNMPLKFKGIREYSDGC